MPHLRSLDLDDGTQLTIEAHDEVTSTNDLMRSRYAQEPEFFTLTTGSQTAGRGRRGRVWTAPAGRTVAISTLVRLPREVAARSIGWLPILAGLALREAVLARSPQLDARVKWPNDVQVRGRKLAGILGEVLDLGDTVSLVIGTGVNLTLTESELPVPTATSLALEGGDAAAEPLVDAYLRALARRVRALGEAEGDAEAAGLRAEFRTASAILGEQVRVLLPAADAQVRQEIRGLARDIATNGELIVRTESGEQRINAGDVEHLRLADPDAQAHA